MHSAVAIPEGVRVKRARCARDACTVADSLKLVLRHGGHTFAWMCAGLPRRFKNRAGSVRERLVRDPTGVLFEPGSVLLVAE